MDLDKTTILGLLGGWTYPVRKRVKHNEVAKGWFIENVAMPEEFHRDIVLTGIYTESRRSWLFKDTFELVALEIKLHGKVIISLEHPSKALPNKGGSTKPLKRKFVKDEDVKLSEIFEKFITKD